MERTPSLVTQVKVWTPLGHQTEERVVSRANNLTLRKWPDEFVDSGYRHRREMPATSQSADLRDLGLAVHEETLVCDDDQEIEEGEIWADEEQTVEKGIQWVKGGRSVNKEKSFGVLQELTSRMVQRDRTGERDSQITAGDSFQKGDNKRGSGMGLCGWSACGRFNGVDRWALIRTLGTHSYAGQLSRQIRGLLGGNWDLMGQG
ncbi:hypothetical protein NDU88_007813 [Pleurodeles waltl]|uniref:Uncharacterized protein n=1 Tax=Pleurodeles waltl TaxID=8319 RepID=A0AAV7VUW1_PLEWA|nr:hypothetical protein NDU88_007813 [Pleurodeles waltl]